MHPRYTLPDMKELWSDKSQFDSWLRVELAVLQARYEISELKFEALVAIRTAASFDLARIKELEAEYDHDLIAFVVCVQEALTSARVGKYKEELHRGLTSYDVEDPALILRLRKAVQLILVELDRLQNTLRKVALTHKRSIMIDRTHGQYAEPGTFGHLLLVYANTIDRSQQKLLEIQETDLGFGKISGAVGTYAGMSAKIEEVALELLGLKPALAETQVLQRDRHARLLNELAITASVISNMAETFWLMMRSGVRQLEEPRKPKQRGSSAMSHKKNPILTERLRGLSRLVRANALAGMEGISNPEFRDISQSSVERVILGGSTGLVHYMANKMAILIDRMSVFPQRMQEELEKATLGVWASQRIRNALMENGIPYEIAYEYTQAAAFRTVELGIHLHDTLSIEKISELHPITALGVLGEKKFKEAFDAWSYIGPGIEYIFGQNGLS